MAGGDVSRPQLLTVGPQLAELEPAVADDAGIRRPPGKVLVGEVVDDAVELALEIESVERNVEAVGNPAGVAGVDGAAAALLAIGARRHRVHERRCA